MLGMSSSGPIRPHPRNAAGDFYIADGCCITCAVMHTEAPGLLAWDETPDETGKVTPHCYVARQPQTEAELDEMMWAFRVSDAGCMRYRGSDPDLLFRIRDLGFGWQIDGEISGR